jgi:hypothetical protein
LSRPRLIRTVVATLLVIEAAVLFYSGVTWIVPYPVMLIIAIGLFLPGIAGWPKAAFAVIAAAFAVLFIFPGSIFALLGSCGGMMNSGCSNEEFLLGVAAYAMASALNIVAAVLIAKPPGKQEV